MPVPDLLVDSRIVDKCSRIERRLFLRKALLGILEGISLTVVTTGVVGSHDSVIHVLQVLVGSLLACENLTGRVSNYIFVCRHTNVMCAILGGTTSEG